MRLKRRHGYFLVIAAVVSLLGAEWSARQLFGLGNPPLYVADPRIEYLLAPGEYRLRTQRVNVNRWHMRSVEADKFDALIIGDSVVNGIPGIDQCELASSCLAFAHNLAVGNVSAPSWGPQNQLEYVRKFGLFDAKRVFVVVSDHDAADIPTFEPLVGVDFSYPSKRPACGISDGVSRLVHAVERKYLSTPLSAKKELVVDPLAIASFESLLKECVEAGAEVTVFFHPTRNALRDSSLGRSALEGVAKKLQLRRCELNFDSNCYADGIHLNALGQRRLAEQIADSIFANTEKSEAAN